MDKSRKTVLISTRPPRYIVVVSFGKGDTISIYCSNLRFANKAYSTANRMMSKGDVKGISLLHTKEIISKGLLAL